MCCQNRKETSVLYMYAARRRMIGVSNTIMIDVGKRGKEFVPHVAKTLIHLLYNWYGGVSKVDGSGI